MRTTLLLLLLVAPLPAAEVRVDSITDLRSTAESGGELKVSLRLQDPLLKTALDYREAPLTTAIDDLGNNLIPPTPDQDDLFRPLHVQPDDPFPSTTMTLHLKSPPRAATRLQKIEGALIVRTFRTQKVVIPNAFETFGTLIEDPLLEAHDIEVQIINPRHAYPGVTEEDRIKQLMKTHLCVEVTGAASKISGIELIDADFNVIPTTSRNFGSPASATWIAAAESPLPQNVAIRLSIPIDPTEHRIPFHLEDVTLP